jgi:hypothetical protein
MWRENLLFWANWGGGGVSRIYKVLGLILKGQYVLKTRAAQEDKNDTQQGILNKIG